MKKSPAFPLFGLVDVMACLVGRIERCGRCGRCGRAFQQQAKCGLRPFFAQKKPASLPALDVPFRCM